MPSQWLDRATLTDEFSQSSHFVISVEWQCKNTDCPIILCIILHPTDSYSCISTHLSEPQHHWKCSLMKGLTRKVNIDKFWTDLLQVRPFLSLPLLNPCGVQMLCMASLWTPALQCCTPMLWDPGDSDLQTFHFQASDLHWSSAISSTAAQLRPAQNWLLRQIM